MQTKKNKYPLQSISSGKTFENRGWILDALGEVTPTQIHLSTFKNQHYENQCSDV